MERLLKDASKLTGQKYDINNLSDVYQAIHAIQGEMGITGTTAKEAEQTLQGSFNSMKAAAQDLLGNLALGQNIQPALEALARTAWTFVVGNLLPMVGNILKSIATLIINNINNVPALIDGLSAKILAKGPSVLTAGLTLITQLAVAIIKATPKIAAALGRLLLTAVAALLKGAGRFLQAGAKFVGNLISGVKAKANAFIDNCGGLAGKALRALRSGLPGFKELGGDIVRGMISGVKNLVGSFGQAIKDMVRSGLHAGQKESKSHSPSRLFRDELGKWIPLGVAEGIVQNTGAVNKALAGMMTPAMAGVGSLSGYTPGVADSITNGMMTYANGQNASTGKITIPIYLFKNGTQMNEFVVDAYDTGKWRKG